MSLVQQIATKAFMFVRSRTSVVNSPDFDDLVKLVGKLTLKDVAYDPVDLLGYQESKRYLFKQYAPCVYTEIYEDETMNMSIFGLRENGEIPLHDHPTMHGVLKVLYGRVSLTSYTKISKISLPPNESLRNLFQQRLNLWEKHDIFPTVINGEIVLTPDDPPIILSPKDKNIHRVAALDGLACFFDLLTPPYYPPSRDCHYFKILDPKEPGKIPTKFEDQKIAWMLQIPPPVDYICEPYPYDGDTVDLDSLYSKPN